jgi:hypothetical protein
VSAAGGFDIFFRVARKGKGGNKAIFRRTVNENVQSVKTWIPACNAISHQQQEIEGGMGVAHLQATAVNLIMTLG